MVEELVEEEEKVPPPRAAQSRRARPEEATSAGLGRVPGLHPESAVLLTMVGYCTVQAATVAAIYTTMVVAAVADQALQSDPAVLPCRKTVRSARVS